VHGEVLGMAGIEGDVQQIDEMGAGLGVAAKFGVGRAATLFVRLWVLTRLLRRLTNEMRVKMNRQTFHTDPNTIPGTAGAYVLLVRLDRTLDLHVSISIAGTLKPGRYLYCGSAKGPGGLKARLTRHFRKGKKPRWHIDRVTESSTVIGAWTFENGNECELASSLRDLPIPIYGFGSTDCRLCPSHFIEWPQGVELPFDQTP